MRFNFHVPRILEIGLDNENLKKKLQGVNNVVSRQFLLKFVGKKISDFEGITVSLHFVALEFTRFLWNKRKVSQRFDDRNRRISAFFL